MEYRYAVEKGVYEDLASGRVLVNRHGMTAFPVRLASELFQRAGALLTERGNGGPYTVYDPCGGGANLLTSLGFLHGEAIRVLVASDVDAGAVRLAAVNLGLLSLEGLDDRVQQLEQLYTTYGKVSHREALDSATRLKRLLVDRPEPIGTAVFQRDITAGLVESSLTRDPIDLVITDLPYGELKAWQSSVTQPAEALLENVYPQLAPVSLVIVVSAKADQVSHPRYRPVSRLKLGKRRAVLLEPIRP